MSKVLSEIEEKKESKVSVFLHKYFNWVIFFVAIFVLFLGYIFFLLPGYTKIKLEVSQNNLRFNEGYVKQKEAEIADLNQLMQTYQKINSEDLDRINKILPPDEEQEVLFSKFESIILKNGFLLKSISLSKDEEKTADAEKEEDSLVGARTVNLNIAGTDYQGLKRLLSSLENNLRLIDVEKVSFSPSNNSVSLTVRTYYLKN